MYDNNNLDLLLSHQNRDCSFNEQCQRGRCVPITNSKHGRSFKEAGQQNNHFIKF